MTPQQAEVEQICEVGLATLFSVEEKIANEKAVMSCVELTYKALLNRAKRMNRAVLNVTQTISTESFSFGEDIQITYIITLVGTVVDMELVKQQQRLQQFAPGVARHS